jgi:hypothetical protein
VRDDAAGSRGGAERGRGGTVIGFGLGLPEGRGPAPGEGGATALGAGGAFVEGRGGWAGASVRASSTMGGPNGRVVAMFVSSSSMYEARVSRSAPRRSVEPWESVIRSDSCNTTEEGSEMKDASGRDSGAGADRGFASVATPSLGRVATGRDADAGGAASGATSSSTGSSGVVVGRPSSRSSSSSSARRTLSAPAGASPSVKSVIGRHTFHDSLRTKVSRGTRPSSMPLARRSRRTGPIAWRPSVTYHLSIFWPPRPSAFSLTAMVKTTRPPLRQRQCLSARAGHSADGGEPVKRCDASCRRDPSVSRSQFEGLWRGSKGLSSAAGFGRVGR